VPGRERPPAALDFRVVRRCARAIVGLAAGQKVWAELACGVLEYLGEDVGERERLDQSCVRQISLRAESKQKREVGGDTHCEKEHAVRQRVAAAPEPHFDECDDDEGGDAHDKVDQIEGQRRDGVVFEWLGYGGITNEEVSLPRLCSEIDNHSGENQGDRHTNVRANQAESEFCQECMQVRFLLLLLLLLLFLLLLLLVKDGCWSVFPCR
jgi:hypothetical protein